MNKIEYWVDLSDYDLETAKVMLDGKRYLYVGFMCHQAIEKIFKAYYSKIKNESPPYSHSLSYLAKQSDLYKDLTDEYLYFIDELEPLNIEARYPAHKERMLKSLNEEKCKLLIKNTQELQEWIKLKL